MNESSSLSIEALKIFTDFLSNNLWGIVALVFILTNRQALSGLFSRIISLTIKNGNSKLGITATPPTSELGSNQKPPNAIDKPAPDNQVSEVNDTAKESHWFLDVSKAIEESRLGDAEAAFKNYAIGEKDPILLEKNKAFYLYLRANDGKDDLAISELEELIRTARTEDTKYESILWLTFIYKDRMQTKNEISIWKNAIQEFKTKTLSVKATTNLAQAISRDGKASEARELLIEQLSSVNSDEQKYIIYKALSDIENKLNNKTIAIYCRDKALEYNASNRDELFSTAYEASNNNINDISISNYYRLIKIDNHNSMALNNFGVCAQNAELNIIAVQNYKNSATQNNTLAMANLGYMFLNAGFIEEANNAAEEALRHAEPHENVYALMTAINNKKEEQHAKWEKLTENTLNRQNVIRRYTEQYYLGSTDDLIGNWLINDSIQVVIELEHGQLSLIWLEPTGLAKSSHVVTLNGKVSGSTFSGRYTKKTSDNTPTTLLGYASNIDIECIGCLSEDKHSIQLISTTMNNDFTLSMSRPSD